MFKVMFLYRIEIHLTNAFKDSNYATYHPNRSRVLSSVPLRSVSSIAKWISRIRKVMESKVCGIVQSSETKG